MVAYPENGDALKRTPDSIALISLSPLIRLFWSYAQTIFELSTYPQGTMAIQLLICKYIAKPLHSLTKTH